MTLAGLPAGAGIDPLIGDIDADFEGYGKVVAETRAYIGAFVGPCYTCKGYMDHDPYNPVAPHRSSDIELEIVQNCLIQVQS